MILIHYIRSTQHRFTRRVLFYPLLSSRCGQSTDTLATKHGKNELKLFLRGIFYFQNFIATITKEIPAKTPITITGVGIEAKPLLALLVFVLLICNGVVSATFTTFETGTGIFCPLGATKITCNDCELSSQLPPLELITSPTEKDIVSVLTHGFTMPVLPAYCAQYEIENGCVKRYFPAIGKFILLKFWLGKYTNYFFYLLQF